MTDLPILFRPRMVQAILAGRKTQTRRIMKPQPSQVDTSGPWWRMPSGALSLNCFSCPYGAPGDQLWVKEAWQYYDWDEDGRPKIRYRLDGATLWRDPSEEWSDRIGDIWEELSRPANYSIDNAARDRRWRSPLYMPRWAARIILEIVNIRVERVQDISGDDARAEGLRGPVEGPLSSMVIEDYADLWDSINGAGSWDTNPWVWAITFRRQT